LQRRDGAADVAGLLAQPAIAGFGARAEIAGVAGAAEIVRRLRRIARGACQLDALARLPGLAPDRQIAVEPERNREERDQEYRLVDAVRARVADPEPDLGLVGRGRSGGRRVGELA